MREGRGSVTDPPCWMGVVAHAASVYCIIWRKPLFTLVMVAVGAEVGTMVATVGRCEGAALG